MNKPYFPLILLCALFGTGTAQAASAESVLAWGANEFGQSDVPAAAQRGVAAIAEGGNHTVALKTNGMVVAWGDNAYSQTTVPVAAQSGVTAIAAGGYHTVAFRNDGSIVAWGSNHSGQTTVPAAAQNGVTAVAGGGSHTVVLLGTAPPPPLQQLTIIRSGANVILTWPATAAGFTLQFATNPVSPADWSPVSPGPVVVNGQNTVTSAISGPRRFFRLSR